MFPLMDERELTMTFAFRSSGSTPTVFAPLRPIRHWLDTYPILSAATARRLARWIPAQCPFERDITVFGRVVAHIPPLCKLNPFYEELVGLRFRALCYLADTCGEDISAFI